LIIDPAWSSVKGGLGRQGEMLNEKFCKEKGSGETVLKRQSMIRKRLNGKPVVTANPKL